MHRVLIVAFLSGLAFGVHTRCLVAADEPQPLAGKTSDWNGFTRYDFEVEGKPVLVVAPTKAAPGRPWIWHGEFFGHKPQPDIELLKRGFHIAYMRVPDMLGSPTAVEHWNAFYKELTEKYGLAKKPGLVGLSRGGLYCYNWAAANPDKVACVYGDAPVCDFKSWPGGKGKGKGSERDWRLVLERYGFADEAAALAYDKNPVDNLAPLARADVPLLHVYGDADEVVPWEENTGLLAQRYRQLGGRITLIDKPGVGHHPHGLDNPRPIVDFLAQHAAVEKSVAPPVRRLDPVGELAAELEPSRLLVYKRVGDRELYLHIFQPVDRQATDKRPCFLVIHGGGWTGGVPRRMYPFADHFARLGMVGVSLEYRLLNARQGTTVFDCVKDGRSAVRYLRSHAEELGIDPEQIVVSGGSAGGHVAVSTALFDGVDEEGEAADVSCAPNALVLLFPVIDTSAEGYGQKKIGDRWKELSPVHHVRRGLPPTLIFHGTGDTVTPFAGAKAFHEAMLEAGNRCQLDVHEDGRHGYLMFDRDLYNATLAKTEAFLKSLNMLPSGTDR
ncbi:MAG: alpha/beta hydrolase fold domain-containing protein [Pirellulaceae bacterium]